MHREMTDREVHQSWYIQKTPDNTRKGIPIDARHTSGYQREMRGYCLEKEALFLTRSEGIFLNGHLHHYKSQTQSVSDCFYTVHVAQIPEHAALAARVEQSS